MRTRLLFLLLSLIPASAKGQSIRQGRDPVHCAPDNGGITLPKGFCATIFADSVPGPRHLLVAQGPDGALYITDDAMGRIWKVVKQ